METPRAPPAWASAQLCPSPASSRASPPPRPEPLPCGPRLPDAQSHLLAGPARQTRPQPPSASRGAAPPPLDPSLARTPMLPGPIKALPKAPRPPLGTIGQQPPPLVLEPRAAVTAADLSSRPSPSIPRAGEYAATRTPPRLSRRGEKPTEPLLALSLRSYREDALAGVARCRRRVTLSLRPSPTAADARTAFSTTRQPRPCALRGSPSLLEPPWRARPERPWRRHRGSNAWPCAHTGDPPVHRGPVDRALPLGPPRGPWTWPTPQRRVAGRAGRPC